MEPSANGKDLKQAIRQQAQANRREQVDKDAVSRMIWQRLASLPEYGRAGTVMGYVHMRDEVRTRSFLPEILKHGKRLVVPYCVGDELELFCLRDLDELALGTFGILEPKPELQAQADRRIDVGQIDLVMVPGVAFDRRGGRVGHGKGYYDRLLRRARPDTALVGLAFECQLFAEIPMQPHDVFMDKVITETAVYEGQGRKV
ncbi:MAG: 5-formyltetrahydrofolate cyclo-ligase [Thermoguttaceae bacterium]|jgi:5-formyltetrahydrofolate cyclo-ligase